MNFGYTPFFFSPPFLLSTDTDEQQIYTLTRFLLNLPPILNTQELPMSSVPQKIWNTMYHFGKLEEDFVSYERSV